MSSKLINLPQMVDLSIGPLETGVINFNMLNQLLHIIVNNLNMGHTKIEIRKVEIIPQKSIESEHLLIPPTTPPSGLQEMTIDLSQNEPRIISVERELLGNSISIESFKTNEFNKKLIERIECMELQIKQLELIMRRTEDLNVRQGSTVPRLIPGLGKKSLNISNSDMSNDHLDEVNDELYFAFNEYDSLTDEEEEDEQKVEGKEESYDELEGIFSSIENLKIQKADLREIQSFNEKITNLEATFLKAMKEVHEMMDAKLDKCSILDLKAFVINHIEYFKTKLEDVSKLVCEESSGTVKLLRNNNCISCGKVVAQRDRENPAYVPKLGESHGSLRYCGGSHTKLDPYEKAFRNDDILLKKFGPAPHVANFQIKGTDGKLYKGSRAVCLCNSNCEFQ